MQRGIKTCEFCGREIWITSHFCLKCLKDKQKPFLDIIKANRIKASPSVQVEMDKLKYDNENVVRASFKDTLEEYLNLLRQHPILFSELQIPSGRFVQIVRHLKFNYDDIHCFKFESRNRLDEGIVFFEGQRQEAIIKLSNIYPKIKIPRWMKKECNHQIGQTNDINNSEQERSMDI
jgi:hypothetical protein